MNDKPFLTSNYPEPIWKWDAEAEAGYLTIGNGAVFSTQGLLPGLNIDRDIAGTIVGIEIL